MKRNLESMRSQKWLSRNSLDNEGCLEYVTSLCRDIFNLGSYKIESYKDYGVSLWITYGVHSYIIYTSYKNVALGMLEKGYNKKGKDEYYFIDKVFSGDTCWYDCLNWIKNPNRKGN